MALEDEADLIQLLMESVPIGVVVLDHDLRVVHINQRQAKLNQVPREAQIGRRVRDFLPQAADVIEPKLQFVLEHGRPLLNQEIRSHTLDGQGKQLHRLASYYPRRDAQGAVCGVLAVVQDSSLDDVTSHLLRESEKRLLRVLDNLFTFVGVMSLDGTLLDANRAPLEAAGIRLDDVQGRKFWDCYWWSYDPDIQAQLRDAVNRCRQGEVWRVDLLARMRDDSRVWVDFMLAPLYDSTGQITHLIPSGIDISQRHASEQALHQSEERYRSVIESTDDAVITKDRHSIITSWNQGAEKLLGYRADEVIGQPITLLFPTAHHEEEVLLMQRILAGHRVAPFDTQRVHRDGHLVDVSVTISPLRDSNGSVTGACKIARDISAQKRSHDAMQHALEEKTALLHEVHHRVKNNLQIVSSLLSLQTRRESPEVQRALTESQSRIKAMALVHQLLYESSNMAQIHLAEYLARLVALIATTYGASSQHIHLRFSAGEAQIRLDIQRAIPCGLIINELVVNAIKHAFTQRPNGQIDVRLALQPDGLASITVSDNGAGLPDDFSWSGPGGLGKQLIPMFVAQLNGNLQHHSTPDGASFLITFSPDSLETDHAGGTDSHR